VGNFLRITVEIINLLGATYIKERKMAEEQTLGEVTFEILPTRMPPIPDASLSEKQRQALEALTTSRGGVRGSFVAWARCPELMERVQNLGAYVRFQATLNIRVNYLVSLLTARYWGSQYQWHSNSRRAAEAGLAAEIIEAISEGRRPNTMAEDEGVAYDFAVEALNNKSVSDDTYETSIRLFGEEGVIDLLGIIGYFGLLGLAMNVIRTPVPRAEPMPLAPFPQAVKTVRKVP